MAHSTDLRERIVNAVLHKRYTLHEAADTFDVGTATVSRYLRRYRQSGDLTPRTSPGRPSALHEHQAWVEQSLISNDLTHDQRCDLFLERTGVRISRATMCRWVQRLGSTRKKTIYASEQNPEARWRFLAWIRGIDPHRLVFVDESGFNVAMTLPYAYAPRGQRAVGRVPKNRGENTSLVAAISLDEGVGDAMTLTGAVDGVAFLAYIEQVIAPKLRPGQIVVLDQLGVHRKPEVREAIEARGCELVLLPGYSPDFNPIELAFSKIKAFVKAVGARTRGALDSAIAAALSTVSLGDVLGWFEHAGVTNHSF